MGNPRCIVCYTASDNSTRLFESTEGLECCSCSQCSVPEVVMWRCSFRPHLSSGGSAIGESGSSCFGFGTGSTMSRFLGRLVRQGSVFRGNTAASFVAPSKGSSVRELPWPLRSGSERCFSTGTWLHGSPVLMSAAKKSDSSSLSDRSVQHATGLEREELEAELRGEHRFDMEPPRGPFGTKDAPAIIPSAFDERIVGCSGGVDEDEHDVVWFKLRKGENYECPVCTQVFQLKTIGEGGRPGGHH